MDIVRLLGTTSLEVQNEEKSKRDGWQELWLHQIILADPPCINIQIPPAPAIHSIIFWSQFSLPFFGEFSNNFKSILTCLCVLMPVTLNLSPDVSTMVNGQGS